MSPLTTRYSPATRGFITGCSCSSGAQEYEADRIAAKVVGGAELAGALRRTYAVSAAWSDFRHRFLQPMRGVRCVPEDPFDAFRQMLADPGYQQPNGPTGTLACRVLVASGSCTVITVQPGDTLSLLACRYRTSVRVLQEVNILGPATTIKAGQRLVVPAPKYGPAACG
jgi:hypothetical protein